jgi:hypothetical protein
MRLEAGSIILAIPQEKEGGVAGRFGKYGDVKRKERLRRNVVTDKKSGTTGKTRKSRRPGDRRVGAIRFGA